MKAFVKDNTKSLTIQCIAIILFACLRVESTTSRDSNYLSLKGYNLYRVDDLNNVKKDGFLSIINNFKPMYFQWNHF